jgi:hypothetical protein
MNNPAKTAIIVTLALIAVLVVVWVVTGARP